MSAVKSPVPSSAPAKQDESLWLKLLQQNSARTVTPHSTVLVIGGNTYQRKDVLRNLAQSSAAGDDDSLGELELVNSAFFEVEDAVFDTPVKVNMWGFHDKLVPHVSQIIKSAETQKLAALVLVDSSKDVDTTVTTLQHRLQQTASIISSLLRQLPTEKVKALQEDHRRYLSSVPYLRTGSKFDDISAEDREAVWMSSDGRFDLSVESFPIPVIVAVVQSETTAAASSSLMSPGGQTILSPSSSLPTLTINKELQGKLRLLCLDAGASLCALPLTLRGQSSDAQQVVQQLRRYVLHRLYPQQWQLTTSTSTDGVNEVAWLSIVDQSSSGAFFVPSGLDSSNLIDIATREKASDRVSLRQFLSSHPTSSAVQVPGSSSASSSAASNVDASTSFQEIESEQDWLASLHKFLSQVADTTPSTAGLSSATGVAGSSAPAGSSMRRASSAYGSQSAMGGVAAATTGDASTRLTASSSSDKLSSSGSGIAEGGGSGKGASTATEKRVPTVARKPSMIPAGAANQNAKDFFSSLMSDSAKK